MALHHHHHPSLQLLTCPPFPSSSSSSSSSLSSSSITFKPHSLSLIPPIRIRNSYLIRGVVEDSSEPKPQTAKEEEKESELASELKKAMQERKDKEEINNNFFSGVAQEITQIEWPPFPKVFSTTALVLAVIFGSTVVLLSLNAVFAELSDRVFAARGLQDFFT
ncbi:PREDICTED: preprotein translocase subunit SECE1 [Lupinus angustifolius]|nr:PREDICTED: preprotein translocase subunit SECE1 [Lupinus angustifolius]XP_019444558.1 PREDICTED: preprotein translocase subunit SECE1 [Lupinus angustifolius]XP_019444559.1 PREDICTED: preprotein translocase subunit SECE1 [Lupinus angustifolius]